MFTFLGTRVRFKNNSISCEWYRNKVTNMNGEKLTHSVHIPFNKRNGRYSEHIVAKEPAWVQHLFHECENKYAIIRKRAKILNKIISTARLW